MTSVDDNSRMLADSARAYIERGYGAAVRARSLQHASGCEPQRWQEFADLGWLGLAIPEAHGGLGGSLPEVCTVAEELGRGLVVEPFMASAVLGATALRALAPPAICSEWLPNLADGSRRIAVGAWEPGGGFDHRVVRLQARAEGVAGYRLDGAKSLVLGGAGADAWLVLARIEAADRMAAFLVPAGAAGVAQTPLALYDGQRAVHLALDGVQVATPLCEGAEAVLLARLGWALDVALLAHAAETVGTMQRAFDITLDYVRTRQQFGRTIASNQVVQHRLVDLMVEITEARALTRHTAEQMDWPAPAQAAARDLDRAVAGTRACVAAAARHVWEESVQLHGAIGMTDEYIVGAYVKRLAAACNLFGAVEQQYARLADSVLGA